MVAATSAKSPNTLWIAIPCQQTVKRALLRGSDSDQVTRGLMKRRRLRKRKNEKKKRLNELKKRKWLCTSRKHYTHWTHYSTSVSHVGSRFQFSSRRTREMTKFEALRRTWALENVQLTLVISRCSCQLFVNASHGIMVPWNYICG